MEPDVSLRFPLLARLVVGLAWGWFAFAILWLTDAACMLLNLLALVGCGFLIGLFWIVVTAIWPYLLRRPFCIVWFTVPLVGMIGVGLACTDVGLRTRVMLCEWALAADVERVRAEGVQAEHTRTVGLFTVEDTRTYDDGVYLFTSQSFMNWHGVAHIPRGSRVAPRMSVRHLYGQWYSFEWRF